MNFPHFSFRLLCTWT